MNPEIKEKWLTALRSGKYSRGENYLKQVVNETAKHCCLGVLCEIYMQETSKGQWSGKEGRGQVFIANISDDSYDSSFTVLPFKVREWAGISDGNASFEADETDKKRLKEMSAIGAANALSGVNDKSKAADFSEVIPFIEKYF